ncbi:hypothetical protein BTVI_135172 [Pitangus sulphuratus]|nr:hypothetical protein BTVI_135172 [Pitangus sulphuratus]
MKRRIRGTKGKGHEYIRTTYQKQQGDKKMNSNSNNFKKEVNNSHAITHYMEPGKYPTVPPYDREGTPSPVPRRGLEVV